MLCIRVDIPQMLTSRAPGFKICIETFACKEQFPINGHTTQRTTETMNFYTILHRTETADYQYKKHIVGKKNTELDFTGKKCWNQWTCQTI